MNTKSIFYLLLLSFIQFSDAKIPKISLTFAIDDTGSMSDDIGGVIAASKQVFDEILHSSTSPVDEFILVTFNDPDAPKLRIKTKNRDDFKRALESLTVGGGRDCAELSMSGIHLALEESRPGSYLYVFTDASAKDSSRLEAVQNLASSKQIPVVFLLTGLCHDHDPHFDVYNDLARFTKGQLFNINKQDVKEILKYVAAIAKSPKTVPLVINLLPGSHTLTIPIDARVTEMYISATGFSPTIKKITAPNGTGAKMETVVDLPTALIVKVKDLMTGNYTVEVGSEAATNVVVSVETSILFRHGFSTVPVTSINETATQPISGKQSHLSIEIIVTNGSATLETVQITNMDDTVLLELPVKLVDRRHSLYSTEPFTPPSEMFKIKVKGYDNETKKPFIRSSATGIEPQKPVIVPSSLKPIVTVAKKLMTVEANKNVRLSCSVHGYPKPDIIWTDINGTLITATESLVKIPYDYLYQFELNATVDNSYTCKAVNTFGEDSQVVKVEIIKEKPQIDKTKAVVHVELGKNVEIKCLVSKGHPPLKISWFIGEDETIEINNETLTLKSVEKSQVGIYRCVAENSEGRDEHKVSLVVDYAPVIAKATSHIKTVEGKHVSLPCNVDGVPPPMVAWHKNGVRLTFNKNFHVYRDKSLNFQVSKENSGTFVCVAHNYLGKSNRTVFVSYVEPVTIEPPKQSIISAKLGDEVTLPCHASGYPKPIYNWVFFKEGNRVGTTLRPAHPNSMKLRRLRLDQEGQYVCIASNTDTKANITYEVKVHAPPRIETIRTDDTFTAVNGDLLNLPCNATGKPKPVITWTKNGENVASGTKWYYVNADGSLILKNVDNMDEGIYVCHAKNDLGEDTEVYNLIVKPYPDNVNISKIYTMRQGESSDIECDISHSKVDMLRWYKNGRLLPPGELTLRNVNASDSGKYTCRVQSLSTDLTPMTKTVSVVVGSPPEFMWDTDQVINFSKGEMVFLECPVSGEPVPTITWYFGDKIIDFHEMEYDLEMTMDKRGIYTCVASNPFGIINRTFEIVSNDCLLDINNDFSSGNQPLILNKKGKWQTFDTNEGYLRIPTENQTVLYCPSGFRHISSKRLVATCIREKTFRVHGVDYQFSDLTCKEEIPLTVRTTGRKCLSDDTETVKIGYEFGSKFLDLYHVCLDRKKNSPVYATNTLDNSLADTDIETPEWQNNGLLPLDFDELYNCSQQLTRISTYLRRWFHYEDQCCFKKRQLVNTRDLPAGLAQKAAYSYLNVVPHWSTCNTKNWDEMERRVRQMAKKFSGEFKVWTGTFGNLNMITEERRAMDVNLEDSKYSRQSVPLYLWKVIQHPQSDSSLAVVLLNVPDLTPAEAYKYQKCIDVCRNVPWMRDYDWRDASNGYIICCRLDDFERSFGLKGTFGPGNRNIFEDTEASFA